MIAVDNWDLETEYFPRAQIIQNKARFYNMAATVGGNRLAVLECESGEAAKRVNDNSLDFVFIDADHSYEGCLRDIDLWLPKIKDGGMISGHDFDHPDFPGVRTAVCERFGTEFLTAEDHVWYKFI